MRLTQIGGLLLVLLILMIVGSRLKNKLVWRISGTMLCLAVLFIAWSIAVLILPDLYGWSGFILANVWCAGLLLLGLLLLWQHFRAKVRRVVILVIPGVLLIFTLGVVGVNAYQDNIVEIRASEDEINLIAYEPFAEGTQAAVLAELSALQLQYPLPRLDGATALYPMYAAFVRATYPEADYHVYDSKYDDGLATVVCSRTSEAFEHLLAEQADMIFVAGVSQAQAAQARAQGLTLNLTPIGREAFVFFVNRRNSIVNLASEDISGIYSGRITNWSELGGSDATIRAYQRPENAGSQSALQQLMGDVSLMPAPEKDIYSTMGGMHRVVADYKNYRHSLGYSFRYYLSDMQGGEDVKLLSIDGVAPTVATIASGEYPLADDFYVVTVTREPRTEIEERRAENTQQFIDWILSPQGQSLVEETGYVPLRQD
ncbi:MAG: PstS family phosphate ABC transporter substrate-binding protein [Peptococcaceae bacterium]|jgi:phosphate transport system substrate-binding protein|nr:PstS family phosphate ABC transporter substrate-binding protein [Peptococcaceae bacterium]